MTLSPGMPRRALERAAARAARGVDIVLDRTVAGGFSRVGYAVRRRLPTWPADPPAGALAGRRILVTGATSGLGAETARQCADLGGEVHLVVRDVDRGEEIAAGLPGEASVWRCDVAGLDSVRAFAATYRAAGGPVDALVHNAGALPAERTSSPQGHELTMAVHVLGPVLMTELLRPQLAGRHGRVVFVTSGGMYGQHLPVDDPDYRSGDYRGAAAYGRSKRTQVDLLPVLAERWAGDDIAVWAMHPGWAATPGLSAALPGFERLTRPVLRDVGAGADTTTWLLAADPRPATGGLWHDRAERPTQLVPGMRSEVRERQRMWDWVAAAIGIDP